MPATINIDPSIALKLNQSNPIANLGQTIQTAAGIQEFTKARELLPYAIEAGKAQSETAKQQAEQALLATRKAQELIDAEIIKGKAESQSAVTQAGSSALRLSGEKAQVGRTIAGALATHPAIVKGENQIEIMDALSQAQQDMINAGLTPREALTQIAPYATAVHTNPKNVLLGLQNVVRQAAGPSAQLSLQTPQLTTTAGGAPALYTAGTGTVSQPNIQNQPSQTYKQTPPQPQPDQPIAATEQPSIGQKYPKRVAGDLRPYAPGEKQDEDEGRAYTAKLTARQGEMTTSRRNLDEVIKEATKLDPNSVWSSGFLGMVNRKFKDFIGDPSYKQLSKDLANVQISNIQAMGGSMDTVSGQQLSRMANGDETYPPSVLIGIARRAYADLTDLDMRATAAQKFSQKFGDSNMNTFKQQWAANSDSKLFEAMAIEKSNLSAEQKKKEFKALIGNDPNVLRELKKKKSNLEKLMNTGEL